MSTARPRADAFVRRRWRIGGQVQGVGFRPFVFLLARDLGLAGFVRNDARGVVIEAQGPPAKLRRFARDLHTRCPRPARIDDVATEDLPVRTSPAGFRIDTTHNGAKRLAATTPDQAVCPDCLRELFDPTDRRFGYPFINCCRCGPRFTIIRRVPYDRPNTTMAVFAMCGPCREQYADPTDRRFHAQPIACPDCGPKLELVSAAGIAIRGDAVAQTAARLRAGEIVAIKGLGGFHLAVRANDAAAVRRLRDLKQRDAKPLAVMCADLSAVRGLVRISPAAEAALLSAAAPIVLAPRRADAAVAPEVAPANHRLGVLLPYTPLHHLIFAAGGTELGALVMTSGNVSDEPLAIDNQEARQRLGPLCDAILRHDRVIERCVDDSVVLDMGAADPLPLRRSRGYVPTELPLPLTQPGGGEPGLCLGADLKNTVAVVRGNRACLSQHLGNLEHALALAQFKKAAADMCDLMGIRPAWIAHDLHPAYAGTAHARALANAWRIPTVGIQHHHAHAAAVLAEQGVAGPALAVVCDGTGYGTDATIWGGELLLADLTDSTRLATLRPLRLPGGDAAARDTRRCGLALLFQAFGRDFAAHPAAARLVPDGGERNVLAGMITRDFRCATSSGTGRFFDGAAALLGLCASNTFEAQAAMAMEAAAAEADAPRDAATDEPLFVISRCREGWPFQIDLTPLVRRLAELAGPDAATTGAAVFHEQLARAWEAAVVKAGAQVGVRQVVLSGGVFCNQRLTERLTELLTHRGFAVLRHTLVPPNDGGLALGQAAIAAALAAAGRIPGIKRARGHEVVAAGQSPRRGRRPAL